MPRFIKELERAEIRLPMNEEYQAILMENVAHLCSTRAEIQADWKERAEKLCTTIEHIPTLAGIFLAMGWELQEQGDTLVATYHAGEVADDGTQYLFAQIFQQYHKEIQTPFTFDD